MPGSVNNGSVRILTQGSARSRDIYRGHASGLYRQPLVTLGDTALAVRVVSDVIAELSDAAGAFLVRAAHDETRGWRWVSEPL